MNKLRVGVIGTGMAFEKLHYPAYQELSDKYEIAALCDVDRFKADSWADRLGIGPQNVYTDFRELARRKDIDLFDIMVPIEKNYEITDTVAAIARKPIICEKPLAPNLRQAKAHAELPRKYGIPVMIAENYRYNEEVDLIRDLVRTKKVGDILYVIQNRVVNFPADMLKDKFPAREWRQYPEFVGGALLDTGVHDLAALRHIFGAVERIQAFGREQHGDFAPFSVVTVNILFKSGVIGTFSFFSAGKEMQRPLVGLRIFGNKGMIYLEERDCGFINVTHNDGTHELLRYRPQRGYYNELLNFYNAAMGKEPISVTPEIEFGDAKMVFDILKSIDQEKIVEVDRGYDTIPIYQAGRGTDRQPDPYLM